MFLVTGGAGFIGSHIVHRLVRDGHRVRILDNFSGGSMHNLSGIINDIEIFNGDIRDTEIVRDAARGVETIFHLAAEPSVPRSLTDPGTTFEINVKGTLNVLMAAREFETRRVVFSTTCAVYGDGPELPKTETMPPRPLTPYAMSKLTGEQLCAMFGRLYGVETVCLRYFNVYGPRQDPNSAYAAAIPTFVDALRSGRRPKVFGNGEQSRDFVAVDDVVRANFLASAAHHANGQVFNIASGRSVTINEVISTVSEVTGIHVPAEYLAARPGDILHSLADVSLSRELLGFEASISFRSGIYRMLEDHVEQVATRVA